MSSPRSSTSPACRPARSCSPALPRRPQHGLGAAHGLCRRGEAGQNPVAHVLDEHAVVPGQEPAHVDVELVEDGTPLAVARFCGAHGRVHDVGEEHGGQQPCGGVDPACPGDEFLHLVDDGVELAGPRQDVGPGGGDQACPGDVLGQVAAVLAQLA